ncbi:EboA domain-containing protein [Leptospira biflexa]|uniref:EboA domain-containing protein n=1 Tax=Leptospira biflexa TaxID=172 RepID=UPI001AEF37F7|nr:EboA domain-containing protein [Leptospira biflexa]
MISIVASMFPSYSSILYQVLQDHTTQEEIQWLDSIPKTDSLALMTSFVKTPRFIQKTTIQKTSQNLIPEIPGFQVEHWNLVRLSRVWLLTFVSDFPKDQCIQTIETLFDTAELNELVALFSALPLLPFPEVWLPKATDAVRSNMGFVFDAIAIQNPFPFQYFSELAWNQLVLKTIFNAKPIELIYGLIERKNLNLAFSIIDFVKERWAAGRDVPANVWQLVSLYVSESEISLIERLFLSEKEEDQIAASLICSESNWNSFQSLFIKYPKYKEEIQKRKWDWSKLSIVFK